MSAAFASLREWLRSPRDRPLLLGPSLLDVYRPRESSEDEPGAALATALRRSADAIVDLQRTVVDAGAELVVAPTASTTAPALHATGQAYRAAALTAAAIDLTRDAVLAAGRAAAVIGEVPALHGSRGRAEARTHVERLATSAIDGVLVLADDAATTRDIVDAASEHRLPAIVELDYTRALDLDLRDASAIVLRGDDADRVAATIAALRARLPLTPVGARFIAPVADAQLAVAAAWGTFAPLSLAILGVAGASALGALPALVDLSRAPRATLV